MEELIKKVTKFRDDRDWGQFHTPENLAKSIVLEASELLENFQWNSEYDEENLKEELADVLIYCLLLGDRLNLDIEKIINEKLIKNEINYPIDKSKGSSKKYNKL